jgi:hypothetical protein
MVTLQKNLGSVGDHFFFFFYNWRRFLEIDQQETRIAYGCHGCDRIGMTSAIVIGYILLMFPTK